MPIEPIILADGGNYEIKNRSRGIRMKLYDDNESGFITEVSTATSPHGNPMVTVEKHMVRFVRDRDPVAQKSSSPGGIAQAIDPQYAGLIYDSSLCAKIEDVSFPYTESTKIYGPITDIPSRNNIIVMSDVAGEVLDSHGVNFESMAEELTEIENIVATPEQLELGKATDTQRYAIENAKQNMAKARARIVHRHPQWGELPRRQFIEKVLHDGAGEDGEEYIKALKRFSELVKSVDVFSAQIITETVPAIYRPEKIGLEMIKLPEFDPAGNIFRPDRLSYDQIAHRANDEVRFDLEQELAMSTEIGEVNII